MNPDRLPFVDVLVAIAELTRAAGVDVMLVGATARDVAPAAEGHDLALRATNDVDIAVAVADAAAFDRLVAGLDAVSPDIAHRFLIQGVEVDVVPFGGIERADRTIIWPDGTTMNTLGFTEALSSALQVTLPGGLTIAVASLAAQTAPKIFAWADRGSWTERDAVDLRSLLRAYGEGPRHDGVYAEAGLPILAAHDFDVRRAGSWRPE